MTSAEQRSAEARTFRRIDAAFKAGDLVALCAAVEDPAMIPNRPIHLAIGWPLVYAIYHSPLSFIATLLDAGADPNVEVDDGFPPLVAALTMGRDGRGNTKRTDLHELLRLLLARGADPNQRGINDYTALHLAVAERNADAVRVLLAHGADRTLRTRIDDFESPLELAQRVGLDAIAGILTDS